MDIPGQVASTDTHNDALKQSDSGERSQSATQSTVGEGTENKPDGLTVDMKSGKAWEIDGKLAFTTVDSSGQISSTATIIHTPNQSDRSQPFCSSNQPALGEGDGNMPDAVGTDVIENDEARNAVAELASTDTGNDTPHQSDSGERSWLSPSTYREGNGNKPDGGKASRSSSKTRWEKYENKLDGLRTSAIESDKAREVAENLASIATEITGQQAPAASDNNARRQIPSLSEEVNGGKMDGLRAAVMESDKAREIARKLRQPFSENGTSTKATPTWTTSANVLSEGTRKTVAASAVTSSATAAGRSNSAGTTDATWGKFDTDAETAAGSTAQNGRQDLPGIGWIRNVALTVNAAGKRTAEAGGDVASTVQSENDRAGKEAGGNIASIPTRFMLARAV